MAWYRCGGGGLPAGLQSDMDTVLNKKFSTSTTYPPNTWPDNVNLLGPLPEKTASGAIAHITDGADGVPLKNWLVTLPASLSGYSAVNGVRTGKNLLDMTIYDGGSYNPAVGTATTLSLSASQFTKTSNAYSIDTTTSWKTFSVRMPVKSGVTYYRKFTMSASGANLGSSEYYLDDDNKVVGSVSNNTDNPHTKTGTLSIPSGAVWFVITFTNRSTATNTLTITEPQIEVGTATAYEAYEAPTQYTASLGRTIYGGTADIVTGEGEDENGNAFTFTPIQADTELGVNNFWADEGDSDVTYRADISLALAQNNGNRGLMMMRSTEPEETEETEETEGLEDELNR